MSRSSQRFFLLACAGVASAFLGLAAQTIVPVLGFLGPGLAFGIAIAAVYLLHGGVRSPFRLLGFIAASGVAFPISVYSALWGTPFVRDLLPGISSWEASATVPLSAIFMAGAIGGFIIFLGAFLLLAPANVSLRGLGRPVLLALGGGVLGVIGWTVAKSAALYALWQVGVAFCIPLVAPTKPTPEEPPRRSIALQLITGVFLAAILAFLGWQIYANAKAARNSARLQAVQQRILREAPPVDGLPPVQAVSCDQALIQEGLAGYFAQQPLTMKIPGHPAAGLGYAALPTYVDCTLQYSRTQSQPFDPGGVVVSIAQYPNAAWAGYKAKYPSASFGALNSLAIIRKFGNRIYTDTHLWSDHGGTLFFFWPSGTVSVTVSYQGTTGSINEEFLRRYLEKYPSAL